MPIISFPSGRRAMLACGAGAAMLCVVAPVLAQTAAASAPFPSKPVRMVVPFAAGGGTDTLARVLGEKMATSLGQPVIIDNKPGAGGIIGTDAVAKAPPDGHTMMLGLSTSLMINQFLYAKLPYDTQRDLTLVYRIAMGPMVLVVNPTGIPAKNGPELLKYVAANKAKLAYGSYGIGSYPHLGGAYMSETQQAQMNHIAYKGEAPMVQDLIGGQIHMAFASALAAKGHIESGKLRAIGVTGDRRMTALPNVPTLAEQGLDDETYRIAGGRPCGQGHPCGAAGTRGARACGGHGFRDRGQLAGALPGGLPQGAAGLGAPGQAIGRAAGVTASGVRAPVRSRMGVIGVGLSRRRGFSISSKAHEPTPPHALGRPDGMK